MRLATRLSRTRSSSGPVRTVSSRARASRSPSPRTTSSSSPTKASLPACVAHRHHHAPPTPLRGGAPRTRASASRPRQASERRPRSTPGRLPRHLRQQAQHSQTDQEPIRRIAAESTQRGAQRMRWGPASCPSDPRTARTAGADPRGSSISDSTPAARATRNPDAPSARCSSSAVLPIPASPRRTSTRLSPVRTLASRLSRTSHSRCRPRSLAASSLQALGLDALRWGVRRQARE